MPDHDLTDRAWRDNLAAHRDDDELRAVYADWLHSRDDPRGKFLALDARIADTTLDDPDYPALYEAREQLGKDIDPTWLTRVEERDARRFDVILDEALHPEFSKILDQHLDIFKTGIPHYRRLSWWRGQTPLTLERGLRHADAEALARHLTRGDPAQPAAAPYASVRIEPNAICSILWAIRWLLPAPVAVWGYQPPFNHRGATRARRPHNQHYRSAQSYHSDWFSRPVPTTSRLSLRDVGPGRVAVIIALWRALDVTAAEARALADRAPCTLDREFLHHEADDIAARLRQVGATIDVSEVEVEELPRTSWDPRNIHYMQAYAGDPRLVTASADDEGVQLARPDAPDDVYRYDWPALRAGPAAWTDELKAAIDAIAARRAATFVTCSLCKQTVPPDYYVVMDDACFSCARTHLGWTEPVY